MSVDVWWSSLTAAEHGLLEMLSETERMRVLSLERPADRGRSMIGAALLRIAVASHLGIKPNDVGIDRTCTECGAPHGAPRVVHGGGPVPWVSVSHSGLLVVVALSPVGPVGVDVQRLSDVEDPAHGRQWVEQEARFKAHAGADDPVRELDPPLDGYVAALAAPVESGPDIVVRHWPGHIGRT